MREAERLVLSSMFEANSVRFSAENFEKAVEWYEKCVEDGKTTFKVWWTAEREPNMKTATKAVVGVEAVFQTPFAWKLDKEGGAYLSAYLMIVGIPSRRLLP